MICTHSIIETTKTIQALFPEKMIEWDHIMSTLTFKLIYTPTNPLSFNPPAIRDPKDIPILVSAMIAQPDLLVTGDYDFHTPEIKNLFAVYTPADFMRDFG